MANQYLTVTVNLKFSEHTDFDDEAIKEMLQNIADGIKKQAEENGITPDGYESTYLTEISVSEEFSGREVIEKTTY